MYFQQATDALKQQIGDSVITGEQERFRVSFDSSKLSFMPDALIRPKNRDEIGEMLKIANRFKVPVTPRGAGTSNTGSAAPLKGGWVLDLTHWNKIRIDETTGMAYAEAGAILGDIMTAAENTGWFYPPDPSSLRFCTIGGNIACNAGGLRGAKYGVTRDYVLALKGFLPTGEYVEWASDLRKYASGFNLRDLWIGSEGTLGIITDAILKLIPKPESRWTFLICFKDEKSGLLAIRELLSKRITPSILEFLDRETVSCAEKATQKTVFEGRPGLPVALIELDGSPATIAGDRETILEWGRIHGLDSREANDPEKANDLWSIRRTCSGAMFEFGDTKLNEDVVIPLRAQVDLLDFIRKTSAETGIAIPTFGHAADGNFHVNIMFNRDNPHQRERARKALFSIMKQVISLGGTVSGEHGIGLAKTAFFQMEHSPAEIAAMQRIKNALDPNGILNPGKIFDIFEYWAQNPIKARLPWEHR